MTHPVQNFITPNVQNEKISTRGNKNAYVSYFDAGFDQKIDQGTINLSFLKGGYKATWLDPSTGKAVSEVNDTLENRQKIIRPSYHEDIVLLLKRL